MGSEAKKIVADNERMFEELKFLHSSTADLESDKSAVQVPYPTLPHTTLPYSTLPY